MRKGAAKRHEDAERWNIQLSRMYYLKMAKKYHRAPNAFLLSTRIAFPICIFFFNAKCIMVYMCGRYKNEKRSLMLMVSNRQPLNGEHRGKTKNMVATQRPSFAWPHSLLLLIVLSYRELNTTSQMNEIIWMRHFCNPQRDAVSLIVTFSIPWSIFLILLQQYTYWRACPFTFVCL